MWGGTILVEGSRLDTQMTGVDLNPVAWFLVKKAGPPNKGCLLRCLSRVRRKSHIVVLRGDGVETPLTYPIKI